MISCKSVFQYFNSMQNARGLPVKKVPQVKKAKVKIADFSAVYTCTFILTILNCEFL